MTELRTIEPGSPAAFIERLLSAAQAEGHSAFAARVFAHDDTGGHAAFEKGSDVKVAVTYRQGETDAEFTDVVRLDRAWTLIASGGTFVRLGCPDEKLPIAFVAAAKVMDPNNHRRHDLMVIDRRGGAGSLVDPTMFDGKEVGRTLRAQVRRHGNAAERKRAQRAATKLNRESAADVSGDKPGAAIFNGAMVAHLIEDPERRGIDPAARCCSGCTKRCRTETSRLWAPLTRRSLPNH